MLPGGTASGRTLVLAFLATGVAAAPGAAMPPDATVLLSPPGAAPNSGQVNISLIGSAGTRMTSANGRYVAYLSASDGISPDDDDHFANVFVYDTQTGTTALASRAADGTAASGESGSPSISADGNRVAFSSDATNLVPGDTNGFTDVFVKNMTTGAVTLVSRANGAAGAPGTNISFSPAISADGNVVAFESLATLDPNTAPGTI